MNAINSSTTPQKSSSPKKWSSHLLPTLAVSVAMLLSGCRDWAKDSWNQQWSIPSVPAQTSLALLSEVPGETLQDKVIQLLFSEEASRDPAMRFFQDFIREQKVDIYFLSPEDSPAFLSKITNITYPPTYNITDAMVIYIKTSERIDGGWKPAACIVLSSDVFKDWLWHALGVLGNELTGAVLPRQQFEIPGQERLSFENNTFSITPWIEKTTLHLLVSEWMSSIIDETVAERNASGNYLVQKNGEDLWNDFCSLLKNKWKFTHWTQDGYAAEYFNQHFFQNSPNLAKPEYAPAMHKLYLQCAWKIALDENLKIYFIENLQKMWIVK